MAEKPLKEWYRELTIQDLRILLLALAFAAAGVAMAPSAATGTRNLAWMLTGLALGISIGTSINQRRAR